MPSFVRTLIAALALAIVGGAAVFAARGLHLGQPVLTLGGPIARVTLGSRNAIATDAFIGPAYRQLQAQFYEPLNAQTVLDGERRSLLEFLHAHHVPDATLPSLRADDDATHDAQLLHDLLSDAERDYGARLGASAAQLGDVALNGVMDAPKDPYTVYLPPHDFTAFSEQLSGGDFFGIGVYIFGLRDGEVIVQPIDGLPAARAGMKPGEVVDSVDGLKIRGLPLDQVQTMIRGPQYSTVRLTTHEYDHANVLHTYTIVRDKVQVPTVHAKMEDGFDYIRLSDFGETSADEIKRALLDGKAKHARGYILDLRDNGGGFVESAVKISSYFIAQGPIVSTIARDGSKTVSEAEGTAIPGLSPLVVLVNKYTASASEITAGAIEDYHVGTILGTKSFGKGVVQSVYYLPNGGALKITTARYVTPLGRNIQHKGITPDVFVDQSVDPALIDTPHDKQLIAAKARLKQLAR